MGDRDEASADDMTARFEQAVALHRSGRLAEAVAAYQQVTAAAPGFAPAHANLAVALRSQGDPQAALAACEAAIAAAPQYADVHSIRGNALLDLNRAEAALASFDTAVTLEPANARFQNNRGNALLRLERPDPALASFDRAVALDPAYAEAHYNRGVALQILKDLPGALSSYDAALAIEPRYLKALANRAAVLRLLGDDEAALAGWDAAVAIDPRAASVHRNRANALMRLGRPQEALKAFNRPEVLEPGDDHSHWNRTLALLQSEQFAEGWREYEMRWTYSDYVTRSTGMVTPGLRARLDPALRAEDLNGRRILLVGEEGVGDVVMFASMVPDVLAAAASVSLICSSRLHGLLSNAFPQLTLLEQQAPDWAADDFDHVLGIGSLGRLYRNRPEDFPGRPYASARTAVRDRWQERLGLKGRSLRVGLSWRGGTDGSGRQARSIPLADLAPLLRLPGCEFVSLQYGDHRAEVAEVNGGLERPIREFEPAALNDLEDLTGLAQSLDMVVSVQTALVHLCGAAGVPCMALLPRTTSWRFGVRPSSTPWYGSVTLLRQGVDRSWSPVIAQVAERLRGLSGKDQGD